MRGILTIVTLIILLGGCASGGKVLDDAARASLPGAFVTLSQGVVHYELSGPDTGDMVVLVHGFSTPMFIWERTAPALREAGFRVLAFDLYGRGYSDRPDVDNDENLFDAQLLELLDSLGIKDPVNLVGLSMGGAISAIFTARHPERVKKLVLIAPAGYPVNIPFAAKLVKAPVLGEALMGLVGDKVIKKGAVKSFHNQTLVADFVKKFEAQMEYAGYKQAILSTLRHFDLNNQAWAFEQVGRQQTPTLLVWGKEDDTVPFANNEKVRAAIPGAVFHAIDGAAHVPHYEQSGVVSPLIIDFLSR